MSEKLDRLEQAVHDWHTQTRQNLTAEADFLKAVAETGDPIMLAEGTVASVYADLIADTITELTT